MMVRMSAIYIIRAQSDPCTHEDADGCYPSHEDYMIEMMNSVDPYCDNKQEWVILVHLSSRRSLVGKRIVISFMILLLLQVRN